MLRRRDVSIVALVVVQATLLWGSLRVPTLGTSPWHHVWSLVVVLFLSGLLIRPLTRSRRFLAIGVLITSVLASLSGFWLLYWKEGIRVDGYQDWGVFWHIAWSWAMLVFFAMHTWINRVPLVAFMRRINSTLPAATVHIGGYVVVVVAFVVTWSAIGRGWFTNGNYIALSLYAWLLTTVPPYTLWVFVQWRLRTGQAADRFQRAFAHWSVRRWIDLALLPIAILAVLSGIPLAFLGDFLDPRGLKYVSKYWHVWPSVAFSGLAFVHTIQAWPSVRTHWRQLGRAPSRPAHRSIQTSGSRIDAKMEA